MSFRGHVSDKSHSSKDLNGLMRTKGGSLGGKEFGLGSIFREGEFPLHNDRVSHQTRHQNADKGVYVLISQHSSLPRQQTSGIDTSTHVCDFFLDGIHTGDGSPECFPLQGILHGTVHGSLHNAIGIRTLVYLIFMHKYINRKMSSEGA